MSELDKLEEKIKHSKQRVFTRAELFRMINNLREWDYENHINRKKSVSVPKEIIRNPNK